MKNVEKKVFEKFEKQGMLDSLINPKLIAIEEALNNRINKVSQG
jgi:hypothetical protein